LSLIPALSPKDSSFFYILGFLGTIIGCRTYVIPSTYHMLSYVISGSYSLLLSAVFLGTCGEFSSYWEQISCAKTLTSLSSVSNHEEDVKVPGETCLPLFSS
jgi:hypothetical protein